MNEYQQKSKIIIKGKDRTADIKSYHLKDNKVSITFNDGRTFSYNAGNVEIIHSILNESTSSNCFNYLKSIAYEIGIKNGDQNILQNHYEKIDFINKNTILAAFLSGRFPENKPYPPSFTIYPFGFNLSQKKAIDNALTNPFSIIEGPPGTGKTQTILNIIANLVMQGKTVAVVSNNNSATMNVFEKLKKYHVDFISANLGSSENKQKFIEEQKPLPNLLAWEINPLEEIKTKQSLISLSQQLEIMLAKKNELSSLKQEIAGVNLEYQHFNEYCQYSDNFVSVCLKPINSSKSMELWFLCEKYLRNNKKPNFFTRMINYFRFGVKTKEFYKLAPEIMIKLCQKATTSQKLMS
ncbi:MAG: AAA family ATPase [Alphaproteobacteria bacterium]|nr:AAA family ATPase [Alphaproteobacteria bacterium]